MKKEDFKECRNPGCNRHEVAMYTENKYCQGRLKSSGALCGSKLKSAMLTKDEKESLMSQKDETREEMHEGFEHKKITKFEDSDTWENEQCDLKEGCPIAPDAVCVIPQEMWENFFYLAGEFDTEWIAYMTGKEDPDNPNRIILETVYYPPQEAGSASVKADTFDKDGASCIKPGTIASVHSHVDFGVFWSQEDDDHMNHRVEIVVNRKREFKARMRVKLKCGEYSRIPCKIMVRTNKSEGNSKELKEVLREKTYTTWGSGSYYRGRGGRHSYHGGDEEWQNWD